MGLLDDAAINGLAARRRNAVALSLETLTVIVLAMLGVPFVLEVYVALALCALVISAVHAHVELRRARSQLNLASVSHHLAGIKHHLQGVIGGTCSRRIGWEC
jgi:hypothetical protein